VSSHKKIKKEKKVWDYTKPYEKKIKKIKSSLRIYIGSLNKK